METPAGRSEACVICPESLESLAELGRERKSVPVTRGEDD